MSKYCKYNVLLIALGLIVFTSCISRYRLDLFMTTDDNQKKVDVESTEYVRGAVIRDSMADEKLTQGDGNCIILRVGTRGEKLQTDLTETLFLGYDEYLRCLVYIELPAQPQVGVVDLKGNSFVHVLGRYDQSLSQAIFNASEGSLQVDSIVDKKMFATLNGDYKNSDENPILLNGKFKVKIAD